MPEYKVINDLRLVFYKAGEVSDEAAVGIWGADGPESKVFILADELRQVTAWLIHCADEASIPDYVAPFTDEQAERESLADDMQAEREEALSIYVPTSDELDEILRTGEIPFLGQPVVYETDDNISPVELGL